MSLMFKDVRWVYDRICGTYVRQSGTDLLWRVCDMERGKFICSRKDKVLSMSLEEIDLVPPPLGMVDYNLGTYFLRRVPKRNDWRQGLRGNNVFMTRLSRNTLGPNASDVIQASEQAIAGKYDSLKHAIEKVQDKFETRALSRDFSLDYRGALLYKNGIEVGDVNEDENGFTLYPKYVYLQESLDETLNKGVE